MPPLEDKLKTLLLLYTCVYSVHISGLKNSGCVLLKKNSLLLCPVHSNSFDGFSTNALNSPNHAAPTAPSTTR